MTIEHDEAEMATRIEQLPKVTMTTDEFRQYAERQGWKIHVINYLLKGVLPTRYIPCGKVAVMLKP